MLLCLMLVPQHVLGQESDRPQRQVTTAGPIELSIELSGQSALIAQPIVLRVQVDAPVNTLITLPSVRDTLAGFSVIDTNTVGDLPHDTKANTRRWVTSIQLESLESGVQEIPSLEIVYRLPENSTNGSDPREGVLKSQPMSIQIISALHQRDDTTRFRDIKDVQALPPVVPERSRHAWLAVCAGLVVCVTALWVRWSRRNPGPAANRWALDEVELIESQYQDKSVNIGQAYARLSTVIRIYLEAELEVPATALASTELVRELPADACPAAAMRRLKQFVTDADELRFSGRLNSGRDHNESPFDSIRAIIHETSDVSRRPNHSRRPRNSRRPKHQERS